MDRGNLIFRETEKLVPVYPGVLGRTKSILHRGDITISKGDYIVIQPVNIKKNLYRIIEAKPIPNKEDRYKPGLNFLDVKKDNRYEFLQNYQLSKLPLFPRPSSPCIEEIKQGNIGNCTLLAVIQSILNANNGAAFIRSMMKQLDDGTVVVRLYDPQTLEKKYIKLNPSILVDTKQKPISDHSALWVHLLEKAFSSMGKKGYSESYFGLGTFKMVTITHKAPIFTLNSIDIPFAMRVLLGIKESQPLEIKIFSVSVPLQVNLWTYFIEDRPAAFSGQYTAFNDYVYEKMDQALKDNQILITSARNNSKWNDGGLIGYHAYSVLKVFKTDTTKYVRLRNPWGSCGLSYTGSTPLPQSKTRCL